MLDVCFWAESGPAKKSERLARCLAHLTQAAVHVSRGEGCGQRCGAPPNAAPVLAEQLLLIC